MKKGVNQSYALLGYYIIEIIRKETNSRDSGGRSRKKVLQHVRNEMVTALCQQKLWRKMVEDVGGLGRSQARENSQ